MLQAGLLRAGSVSTLLYSHLVTAATATLLWLTIGFSLATSTTGMVPGDLGIRSVLGAPDSFLLRGVMEASTVLNLPELSRALYSLVPATVAPCIVVSAAAERIKPSAMALLAALWLPAVYAPVVHAVASGPGALLWDLGVLDACGARPQCNALPASGPCHAFRFCCGPI
jgi:ammonium transporter, Amt family